MGLYPINCPTCGKGHLWFSGSLDTRCGDCQKANPVVSVKTILACGHEACTLQGCFGCSQHCGKPMKLYNAIKEVKEEESDATKTKKKKRKGDTK